MNATRDLQLFIHSAVRGICDFQDEVEIEVETSGRVVTLVIYCASEDLKFVYSKLKPIKVIAIAIAQRNKSIVHLIVHEKEKAS